jgi:hypothetical protein
MRSGSVKPTIRHTIESLKGESQTQVRAEPGKPDGDIPSGLAEDRRLVVFDGKSLTLGEPFSADRPGAVAKIVPRQIFKVRLARSRALYDAGALVQRRYSHRGYDVPTLPAEEDDRLTTFVAYSQGVVVGTVSIRLDAPEKEPLAADALYAEELGRLRRAGARICEFTRLAVDSDASSKPILASLFHTAYLYAFRVRDYNCAVIEVNPRHVVFYRRALNFEVIGAEKLNRRVNAPAVLLCVEFAAIAKGLAQYAGRIDLAAKTRTLFPYGFPPEEEAGVLNRLQALRSDELV